MIPPQMRALNVVYVPDASVGAAHPQVLLFIFMHNHSRMEAIKFTVESRQRVKVVANGNGPAARYEAIKNS